MPCTLCSNAAASCAFKNAAHLARPHHDVTTHQATGHAGRTCLRCCGGHCTGPGGLAAEHQSVLFAQPDSGAGSSATRPHPRGRAGTGRLGAAIARQPGRAVRHYGWRASGARALPGDSSGLVPRKPGHRGAGLARRVRHAACRRGARQARRELHAARGRARVGDVRRGGRPPALACHARRRAERGAAPMIPELGVLSLGLALGLAAVQASLPLAGARLNAPRWMALAGPAAWGQFVFLTAAFAILAHAFLSDDFSVAYVARNSNSALPWYYKLSAVWGAHEGSLLLWAWMLAAWTCAVCMGSRKLPRTLRARGIAVMGMISVGFVLFLIATSNPFVRLLPETPPDGNDLNPLLQDLGLIFHPPMLYLGYVGFAVACAFAIGALRDGHIAAAWARWSRPWTLVAWAFLGSGIALGSWWAYYELGWGSWWFWDPVENASFMPWLVGTALIHSLAATEKRGVFKSWTVLLAIAAFSLSLLGTFLVRSGVLTSVHAFATDPERGVFILAFLLLVVGGSLALYAFRAPAISGRVPFSALSRETLLLVNNLLLSVAAAMILLGTLYPLLLDALSGAKLSVGPPYFNTLFVPLMAVLMVATS